MQGARSISVAIFTCWLAPPHPRTTDSPHCCLYPCQCQSLLVHLAWKTWTHHCTTQPLPWQEMVPVLLSMVRSDGAFTATEQCDIPSHKEKISTLPGAAHCPTAGYYGHIYLSSSVSFQPSSSRFCFLNTSCFFLPRGSYICYFLFLLATQELKSSGSGVR